MKLSTSILTAALAMAPVNVVAAQHPGVPPDIPDQDEPPQETAPAPRTEGVAPRAQRPLLQTVIESETLTNYWWGHGEDLEQKGVTLTLNFFVVFQASVSGGLQTDNGTIGQYDLSAVFDLERLAQIEGGLIYVAVAGGWLDGVQTRSGPS